MMERDWRAQCEELKSQPSRCLPHVAEGKRFDLWWPPSACPGCGNAIAAQHNIPVLSFLWLKGGARVAAPDLARAIRSSRCRGRARSLSLVLRPDLATVAALGFTWTLIALTLIDLDTSCCRTPSRCRCCGPACSSTCSTARSRRLSSSVLGAAAGYLSLWSVY